MTSLQTFSIGIYNPTKHLRIAPKKFQIVALESQKRSSTRDSITVRRRDAVRFGICFSFLHLLHIPVNSAAAEEKETCEFAASSSGLEYCDKVVGTGPEAVQGQLIKAHYVGRLEDGKVFDSSYNRGKPLTFRVGAGEVIKGWDEGILGGAGIPAMHAGGKRRLRIPPALGYGMRGAGCRGGACIIPPDSTLLFDVEFIGKI